jgi:hypothetical protein
VAPVPYLSLLGQSVSSDSLGWWRLDGQLTNSGQAPARHVIVLVRFFDASQSLVTTRPAIVQPTYAEPGQVLPFSLTWPPDPRIVTLTLWPDWVDPAPDP